MGLSSFMGLCVLMLIVMVALLIAIFITSIRLSEERENNFVLSSLLEQRENELKALRSGRTHLAGRHR
ncbi:hypothetical protein [Lelliottia nimipressuralis]|uniref:hypothetical protein n=1 Tax=Lelliottia nimipressuralis TaxID=69220 RepID=UPI0028A26622|nr:hypothetical protein [Lelliottia nimipressuralis]